MRAGRSIAILFLVVSLAACGPAPTTAPTAPSPTPTKAQAPTEELVATPVAAPEKPGRQQAVQVCVRALAEELGLPEGDIQVLEVEPMEWPDTSLGCPEPGMMYAQVITPGFRVRLRAGEKTYVFHTDGLRAVTCGASAP
ncbi:MAG: hypothetical protein H5T59_09000 [Anaerolineae bacterium]|nr:hypothetical protein [Anaerolineae bacterium]